MGHLHDAPASGSRSELAAHLRSHRTAICERIAADLIGTGDAPLMVRVLVAALATAIESGEPDPVVHWARMTRIGQSSRDVANAVDVACTVVAKESEEFHVDLGLLVVFLEIVRGRVADALGPSLPGIRADDRHVIDSALVLLRARDEATCAHSRATGEWCTRLCAQLGLPVTIGEFVAKAGVLHDIGKIATPDSVLLKPSALDADEWAIMREHAPYGAQILSEIAALARYAPIVRSHHERIDGTGYPDRLRGDQIPYEARIVAVADAFHAMVSDRPYRPAMTAGEALRVLRDGRGTQWEAAIVDAMVSAVAAERVRAADEQINGGTLLRSAATDLESLAFG